METKVCNKCKIEKPLTEFYHRTPKGKSRFGKSYPQSDCKVCSREYQRNRVKNNTDAYQKQKERATEKYWEERNAELPELMEKIGKVKICSKCGFEGSVEHFSKGADSPKNKIYKSRLKGVCKVCRNKQQVEYRKNNPDKFKKYDKKTYARRKKDPEFMEYKKEHSQEYSKRPEVRKRNNKSTMERRRANGTYHTRRLLTNTYNQLGSNRPPNQRTKKLIGYDGYELIEAIGEKPKGAHDIDHLIPLSWFVKDAPPHIACDLRNLEWKKHKDNITKRNHYADPVSTELFEVVKPYLKEEYITRFEIKGDMVEDTYKVKVLELWEQSESISVLFG